MVAGQCLAMGNGSIKVPRAEENSCLASIHTDPPGLDKDILREEELARRDQEFRAQELQLQYLQSELEAKVSQVDKLQDAIGYNSSLGCSPQPRLPHSPPRFSVINQAPSRFHRVAVEVHRRLRAKEGVSAEPTSENFCGGAIMNNDFLKKLEPQHMREMVDCMYEKVYRGTADGLLEVFQNGKPLGEMRPGTAFGELAILYNCKRTATVKAVSQSHIWALDRQTFQTIMMQSTQARHDDVSLLRGLPEEKLAKVVDCLEVVIVTQSTEGLAEPQEIKTLGVGDYFGEKALISEDVRSANIICNENDTHCLVVDRDNFNQMVGTYEELQAYLKEYVDELSGVMRGETPCKCTMTESAHSPHIDSAEAQELRRLREKISLLPFQDLEVIATLGMGGFGRVELVKLKDEDTTFALKCIKKKHIVDTRQQEHIYSEKNILQQTNSSFIIRLFRTYRDDKFVYMLLEVCLGGELWTVLRDMSYFEEPTARFCTGCVLEAFDYLHTLGIIYRDLKPENLLLDAEGYVKMADFGFAKKIGLGKKTWTFCGTPEYVAPNPPFAGTDPIKIYTMVLHGIEKVDFPKRIGKRPDDLIRRLCKLNPVERLGNKKNGIIDIKKHKWFQGFNWEGLRRHKLPSPLRRELKGPMDHSHFDLFPPDTEEPPDELSAWDKDF
ncbi:hypothetical protein F7725_024520 [Dissostichus mawsoni]|uniref:cGMP-dependent protein kinase n=1 Tax=Dissostichus mawsoni TaxID=36200 RepID=A0A7J5Y1A7_DISMA|nr:hypothetical protein F7725_024520 [Dissostichus mawsoni]